MDDKRRWAKKLGIHKITRTEFIERMKNISPDMDKIICDMFPASSKLIFMMRC
jgi:plasmid maintenance system antidote protein VapI